MDMDTCLKMKIIGLEKYKLVLGEIQRCSKRSVDTTCLQMQMAGFDKCKTGKPANPEIGSAQIHICMILTYMYDFDKSMKARHTDVIYETWGMHTYVRIMIRNKD